jgi:hypothetical protein
MRTWIAFLSTVVLGSFVMAGCGPATEGIRTSPVLLPTHIRKIAIRPITNKTSIFGLEEKLRLDIEEEFIRDGRLAYVNAEGEADGIVVTSISRYIKEPISYDSNHVVEEFKLLVIVDLKFVDRVNNVLLWEEPRLDQEVRYFVETKPGGMTEEEAREDLWELFASDIVKRTIDGFGSVSGASSRKISSTAPPISSTATLRAIENKTPPPTPY